MSSAVTSVLGAGNGSREGMMMIKSKAYGPFRDPGVPAGCRAYLRPQPRPRVPTCSRGCVAETTLHLLLTYRGPSLRIPKGYHAPHSHHLSLGAPRPDPAHIAASQHLPISVHAFLRGLGQQAFSLMKWNGIKFKISDIIPCCKGKPCL